jgi:hypothetical protein
MIDKNGSRAIRSNFQKGRTIMIKYPKLKVLPTVRETTDVFKGYHRGARIGEGEFYEMENLCSDHFPILAPRAKRGVYASPEMAQGLIAKDEFCYIDGSDFVAGDRRVPLGLAKDGKTRSLISMGAYVIVMPDKKYVNTADLSDFGAIDAKVQTTAAVRFSLCGADGTDYENVTAQGSIPSNPADRSYWLDTGAYPRVLRQYHALSATWISLSGVCMKLSSPGIGQPFFMGDGIYISGLRETGVTALSGFQTVTSCGDDYVIVNSFLCAPVTQSAEFPITVERKMPDLDFIVESENRLWGCRYCDGGGEIYACKRGDFKNWSSFVGSDNDSFAATVGTDGPFTGAVTHLGYPLFFKEGCVHTVYGDVPSNFQIRTTSLRGVQKGCSGSIAAVGETLYYKSRSGVCAYDGSLPEEISLALGDEPYGNAVAGALGNKYYISMADGKGEYHLFVYDTLRKLWHREDGTHASDFCAYGGELYYIDCATGQIRTVKGTGERDEAPIRWSATTGIIGMGSPDKKYVSRMDVRMKIDVGASVSFFAEYDSSGEYEYLCTLKGKQLQSFSVPIRPKRCDHFRLRIVGTGEAKILSICKTMEKGGE